ncbi:NAD(P)-dependent oxidoreductase [Bacillus timonensis]|nr:NAD(P)-dependent oxidoreductase [Bacillus timonensis]
MKILITGGTGYIGSTTTEVALAEKYEVHVLTRSEKKAKELKEIGVSPLVGDLLKDGEWINKMKDFEYIIHLAAPPTWGKKVTKKVAENYKVNHFNMTKSLLDVLKESKKLKKLVYVAGTSYLGDAGTEEKVNESFRSEAKGWGPYIKPSVDCLQDYKKEGLPIVTAFPGMVYGPDSWLSQLILTPLFENKKLTNLKGTNPIMAPIHIEDCARAFLHLLQAGEMLEDYILVDNECIPSESFSNFAGEVLNKEVRRRYVPEWLCHLFIGPVLTDYAKVNSNFSNEKLKSTNFEFKYPTYKEGIPNVIQLWLEKKG